MLARAFVLAAAVGLATGFSPRVLNGRVRGSVRDYASDAQPLDRGAATAPYFPNIDKIQYEGPDSKNPLAFSYYNEDEVIMGKSMKEWLKFGVAYWHTWRGYGADIFGLDGSATREWDDINDPLEMALKRVDVHFEFCEKLGAPYYCFHDRDMAPEGATVAESEANLKVLTDKLLVKQKETGIKLLWGTANLFSHRRYMNGGATNPDPEVVCMAANQVKNAMEATHKLGGQGYVLWGGREGYQCLLNTDMKTELDNMATFLRLVADHKKKIGADFQLMLEPKPREPMAHQYDYDAATVMGFLKEYGLDKDYKINLEANHGTLAGHTGEHETAMAYIYDMLGSIDANRNEAMLGWDTDMFPMDLDLSTYVMMLVIKQGGMSNGGFNFDAKVRRESTDVEDLFIGHVNGMDNYARGLRNAAKILEDGELESMVKSRYAGFSENPIGKRIRSNDPALTLDDLADYARENPEPAQSSGQMEKYESIFNYFSTGR